MKRVILFSLFFFFLLLQSASACEAGSASAPFSSSSGTIPYSNSELGFSLSLPGSWQGRYSTVTRREKSLVYVEFLHKGILKKNKYGGRIFLIEVHDSDQGDLGFMGGRLIGFRNGRYFYFVSPTDVQTESATSEQIAEYEAMKEALDGIFNSIRLK